MKLKSIMAKFKLFLESSKSPIPSIEDSLKKFKVVPVSKSAFKPEAPLDQFSSDAEIKNRIKEVEKAIAELEKAHATFHSLITPTAEQAAKYRDTISTWPKLNYELERLEADLHGKVPDGVKKG